MRPFDVRAAGIWASGLSISAQMGVRDNNEASWTQVLEVLEYMSDATHIPILVDGDTGACGHLAAIVIAKFPVFRCMGAACTHRSE